MKKNKELMQREWLLSPGTKALIDELKKGIYVAKDEVAYMEYDTIEKIAIATIERKAEIRVLQNIIENLEARDE